MAQGTAAREGRQCLHQRTAAVRKGRRLPRWAAGREGRRLPQWAAVMREGRRLPLWAAVMREGRRLLQWAAGREGRRLPQWAAAAAWNRQDSKEKKEEGEGKEEVQRGQLPVPSVCWRGVPEPHWRRWWWRKEGRSHRVWERQGQPRADPSSGHSCTGESQRVQNQELCRRRSQSTRQGRRPFVAAGPAAGLGHGMGLQG